MCVLCFCLFCYRFFLMSQRYINVQVFEENNIMQSMLMNQWPCLFQCLQNRAVARWSVCYPRKLIAIQFWQQNTIKVEDIFLGPWKCRCRNISKKMYLQTNDFDSHVRVFVFRLQLYSDVFVGRQYLTPSVFVCRK